MSSIRLRTRVWIVMSLRPEKMTNLIESTVSNKIIVTYFARARARQLPINSDSSSSVDPIEMRECVDIHRNGLYTIVRGVCLFIEVEAWV